MIVDGFLTITSPNILPRLFVIVFFVIKIDKYWSVSYHMFWIIIIYKSHSFHDGKTFLREIKKVI